MTEKRRSAYALRALFCLAAALSLAHCGNASSDADVQPGTAGAKAESGAANGGAANGGAANGDVAGGSGRGIGDASAAGAAGADAGAGGDSGGTGGSGACLVLLDHMREGPRGSS